MLGFNVTKSTWYRKTSRDNSVRPKYVLLLRLVFSGYLHMLNRLCLVNTSSILDDSLHLVVFVWSVVSGQEEEFLPFVSWHDRPTVADIRNVALFADDKDDDTARTTTLMHGCLLISILNEATLSFEATSCQSLGRVPRKRLLINDYQVKLVFQEVWTGWASMTIVDREVAALWPTRHVLARCRLGHVQNDRHPILVVVTLDTLVSVCCVRRDQAVRFGGEFRRLKIFQRIHHFWRTLQVVVNIEHVHCRALSISTDARCRLVRPCRVISRTRGICFWLFSWAWLLSRLSSRPLRVLKCWNFRFRDKCFIRASSAWNHLHLFLGWLSQLITRLCGRRWWLNLSIWGSFRIIVTLSVFVLRSEWLNLCRGLWISYLIERIRVVRWTLSNIRVPIICDIGAYYLW